MDKTPKLIDADKLEKWAKSYITLFQQDDTNIQQYNDGAISAYDHLLFDLEQGKFNLDPTPIESEVIPNE